MGGEDKIIYLEDNKPHAVSEVICVKCLKRWISVRPETTLLKESECPGCGETGFAIETGERMDDYA